MKLDEQNRAVIQALNSARFTITQQVKKERPEPKVIMEQLLNVQCYAADQPEQLAEIQEQALSNITKLMDMVFIEEKPQQYNVAASVFSEFNREFQQNTRQQVYNQQLASHSGYVPNRNNNVTQAAKAKFGQFSRGHKVEEEKKQAQFVCALGLIGSITGNPNINNKDEQTLNQAKMPSVRKKFVPPFKKNDSDVEEAKPKVQEVDDPRLRNLEPRLVEAIQSEILEGQNPVKWSDIAGLTFAKKTIYEMIVWPMLRPDIFKGLRRPPKGILLFGPPGTGKTLIGKAIATESKSTFFSISSSSLTSKWVGQSQKLVKTLFIMAKIRQPSVIFIDEIDSLLCARSEKDDQATRRIKTEFLVQLDGAKSIEDDRVLIIGATNRPDELDEAVKRRFVKKLYIPLPNIQGRIDFFKRTADNEAFKLSQQDILEITKLTKGYSGADLRQLSTEASMMPIRKLQGSIENIQSDSVPAANLSDLKEALRFVRPTVNRAQLEAYNNWNKENGSYQFNNQADLDS